MFAIWPIAGTPSRGSVSSEATKSQIQRPPSGGLLFAGHHWITERRAFMYSSRSEAKVDPYPEVESKRATNSSQSDLFGRHPYLDGRLDLAIGCWDMVVDRQALSRRRLAERLCFPLSELS